MIEHILDHIEDNDPKLAYHVRLMTYRVAISFALSTSQMMKMDLYEYLYSISRNMIKGGDTFLQEKIVMVDPDNSNCFLVCARYEYEPLDEVEPKPMDILDKKIDDLVQVKDEFDRLSEKENRG